MNGEVIMRFCIPNSVIGIFFIFIGVTNCQINMKTDGPPVTRSEVIRTAHEYSRIHWFMGKENQSGKGCNGGFKSQYDVGYRIGVGYKWSGWDDVDAFIRDIQQG